MQSLGACPQAASRPDPLPGLCREFRCWCWFIQLWAAWECELDIEQMTIKSQFHSMQVFACERAWSEPHQYQGLATRASSTDFRESRISPRMEDFAREGAWERECGRSLISRMSVYLAVSNVLPQPRLHVCLCVQAQLLSLCKQARARLRAVLGKVCLRVCVHVVTARVSVCLDLDRLTGKAQHTGNGIRMASGSLQLGLPSVWVATGTACAHVQDIPDSVFQPSRVAGDDPTRGGRGHVCVCGFGTGCETSACAV